MTPGSHIATTAHIRHHRTPSTHSMTAANMQQQRQQQQFLLPPAHTIAHRSVNWPEEPKLNAQHDNSQRANAACSKHQLYNTCINIHACPQQWHHNMASHTNALPHAHATAPACFSIGSSLPSFCSVITPGPSLQPPTFWPVGTHNTQHTTHSTTACRHDSTQCSRWQSSAAG